MLNKKRCSLFKSPFVKKKKKSNVKSLLWIKVININYERAKMLFTLINKRFNLKIIYEKILRIK